MSSREPNAKSDLRWYRPLLCCAAVCLLHSPQPDHSSALDLDVGIPPGSPVTWGQRFPSITPRRGPLFPITPRGSVAKAGKGSIRKASAKDPENNKSRTVVHAEIVEMDVHVSSSFGVVRILTMDILNHLTWLARTPKTAASGPITGPHGAGPGGLPRVSDAMFWSGMSALLRLMLHPQLVSEKEAIAHLIELGEPALAVLGIAKSERSLRGTCREIEKRIPTRRSGAAPLPGKTPRAAMLKRFLASELTVAYPYDPEGGFGRRFLLMAEELEPYIAEYAHHGDSFVRRNAVAALARYRTDSAMQALAKIVGTTDDPVVLMRSLAGLGNYQTLADRSAILTRLKKTKDPIEKVALVVAAGRMGMFDAVPLLVKYATGKKREPDLFQAVLSALIRLRPRGNDRVEKLAKRFARAARAKPRVFRVNFSGPRADVPDTPDTRGQVIEQLAVLLQARLNPGDEKLRERVLEFLKAPGRAGRKGVRSRAYAANNSLGGVHPPVQILFLDTLRDLGEQGVKALAAVANDDSADPILRGHALSILPFFDRQKAAIRILDTPWGKGKAGEKLAITKIYALELLDKDGHDRLQEICREMLKDCAKANGGSGSASDRYIWLSALRALSRRHVLKTEDVLKLMEHPEARKVSKLDVHRQVRDLVDQLVTAAVEKLSRHLHKRIHRILDLVIRYSLNKSVNEASREKLVDEIYTRLTPLKGRKRDVRLSTAVKGDIIRRLLGFKMSFSLADKLAFEPAVLLDEEILFALGRTKTAEAAEAIAGFLTAHPASPLTGTACLALGMTGTAKSAKSLLAMLEHADGYTRFCAYEALRHLTAQDFFADWIYGTEEERAAATAKYQAYLKNR